jgi:hypothetical protein
MNFARQDIHPHEITTTSVTNQSLDFTGNPLERRQSMQLGPKTMAGRGSSVPAKFWPWGAPAVGGKGGKARGHLGLPTGGLGRA